MTSFPLLFFLSCVKRTRFNASYALSLFLLYLFACSPEGITFSFPWSLINFTRRGERKRRPTIFEAGIESSLAHRFDIEQILMRAIVLNFLSPSLFLQKKKKKWKKSFKTKKKKTALVFLFFFFFYTIFIPVVKLKIIRAGVK